MASRNSGSAIIVAVAAELDDARVGWVRKAALGLVVELRDHGVEIFKEPTAVKLVPKKLLGDLGREEPAGLNTSPSVGCVASTE